MASVAQARAARDDAGPQLQDPVAALHAQQLADPGVNPPERGWARAELPPARTAFRFRSKPGFRLLSFTFKVPPETGDDDLAARYKKAYDRVWRNRREEYTDERRLAADYGERIVKFKPVAGKFECFFETDDPKLAAWLRRQPEFGASFYEELAPMAVTLPDGTVIHVVPQGDADRQALAALAG